MQADRFLASFYGLELSDLFNYFHPSEYNGPLYNPLTDVPCLRSI